MPVNDSISMANLKKVVCAACEFGEGSKRPGGAIKTKPREH